ncbi:MAG TPA: tetratricopeptide repeat protein [Terracidiphilus sp.]|nr:tetratricopeptide repeat protein [Terracidiphilus sp.]
MNVLDRLPKAAFLWALAGAACALSAQTYQIGGSATPAKPQAQKQQQPSEQLGWGSNIQNARIARAAQLALQHGEKWQALDYARRAVKAAPNDPQLWFLLGYAARLNNQFKESEAAYQHGLALNPGSLDGISGLAQDYSQVGRNADAERLLGNVIAADPKRRDDIQMMGELHMRDKDYEGALKWLTRAESLRPDARSEVLLAISYQQLHQMDKANHYLEIARHRDPNNPDVERSLANYYRTVGKYGDAIAALKAIKNPHPDVVAELGYTYQLDGKMEDSARAYARAADAAPKDLEFQLSAAQAQVGAGAPDAANPFLARAATLDAQNYRLHAIRGEIDRMEDHNDEAVKEYNQAISHLPAEPVEGPLYGVQLHVDLMQIEQALGDDAAAHRELATAQQQIGAINSQGPGRGSYLRLRAVIRLAAGDLDGALADVHEALALNSTNRDDLQLDGDILMKMGRTEEAMATYKRVLAMDPKDRFALISAGYASRALGRNQDAEKYFKRLAQVDPKSYVPFLALGDLYTSERKFPPAQAAYTKAYVLSPKHAMIVAGGINAGVEAHDLGLAAEWMHRVTDAMANEPQVLREEERYLSFKGDYAQSAELGEKAIKLLPKDRDVVVYLGYDLLYLGRYEDLLALTQQYNDVLPKEPDIPLLAGYVHKHNGQNELARQDFTEALQRDPDVVTAYVNRGYMLNDLHQPGAAADDFESALKREPHNGEAHLGLAYADLDLHKPQAALKQADLAEQAMGDMRDVHVIRATAYGREDMLSRAAAEYRAALRFTPNDGALHLGLGNTMFSLRHYHAAIGELQTAAKFSPNDATIYALLARSYASLDLREPTYQNVQRAEQIAKATPPVYNPFEDPLLSSIYISTGEALSTLGDQKEAMQRFRLALDVPHANRVSVRLAIAQVMTQQGHTDDAERQVALGLMEAAAGDSAPPSGGQYVEAADVFRGMHNYRLSQDYLQRAKSAGAPDSEVRVGMANNYLAVGDTTRAKAELAAVNTTAGDAPSYQYLLAEANVFRQEHQGAEAMTSFAQATNAGGEDQTAEMGLLQAGGAEGWSINPTVSMLSDFSVDPIYEDTTVYVLDSKLDATFPVPPNAVGLLPPPRSSIQTQWTDAFHLHLAHIPTATGFFQLRNARGQIDVPATNSIVNRSTTDAVLNIGLDPTIRIGTSVITFDSGIQETIRRDSLVPAEMNQNLFRMFTYMTTSSLFNAISISGYVIREAGPFTESNLSSKQFTAAVDFRIGSPWGRTALLTGWGENKQTFSPVNFRNYYTSSYIGVQRRFGDHLDVRAMLEDLRSWRVVGLNSGIAQNLRPNIWLNYSFKRSWNVQFSSAFSSTRGFHIYDAIQNGFSISYAMPIRRKISGNEAGPLTYAYPIRFAAGMQDEDFFNFPGPHSQQLRPYIGITVF